MPSGSEGISPLQAARYGQGFTLKGPPMHASILQIFKLNEAKEGTSSKTGRPYRIQDAECAILGDDGSVQSVGVLVIPRELDGQVKPGVFMGSFALRPDTSREGGRRIGAVLVGLQPYAFKGAK